MSIVSALPLSLRWRLLWQEQVGAAQSQVNILTTQSVLACQLLKFFLLLAVWITYNYRAPRASGGGRASRSDGRHEKFAVHRREQKRLTTQSPDADSNA